MKVNEINLHLHVEQSSVSPEHVAFTRVLQVTCGHRTVPVSCIGTG